MSQIDKFFLTKFISTKSMSQHDDDDDDEIILFNNDNNNNNKNDDDDDVSAIVKKNGLNNRQQNDEIMMGVVNNNCFTNNYLMDWNNQIRNQIKNDEQSSMINNVSWFNRLFNNDKKKRNNIINENNCNEECKIMYQMKIIQSTSEIINEDINYYQVKSINETLNSIATKFNTTPTKIKILNRLQTNHIFIGQNLLIP